ncbi:MAG: glycosyltransferase family 39 protein [Caloramator sp.]|nr:glycosyltransferase family 39 protein [Caloramator sp.]
MKKKILVLVIIFILLNIYISIRYGNHYYLGSFTSMNNDDVKYIRSGLYLLMEGRLIYRSKIDTVYIMPGLSILLALFLAFFSLFKAILAFRIFQAFIQGASLLLIYLLAKEAFNERVGALASLIDALYLPEYFATQVVLTEVIFKFLFLCSLYFLVLALKEDNERHYYLSGLFWSLSLYFKPVVALLPVVLIIYWIRQGFDFKRCVKISFNVAIIFILILSPWWIRNYFIFKRFIPFTMSSGNPMLQATYVNYDQSKDYVPYETSDDEIRNDETERRITKERFIRQLKKDPKGYLYWYLIKKQIYLFNRPFYWRNVFGVRLKYVNSVHNFIVVLGFLGMLFSFGRIDKILKYVVVYFIIVYIPYFTFSRYGYPLMPILIIFCSYILQKIFLFDKRRIFNWDVEYF